MKPYPHAGFLWVAEAAKELKLALRTVQEYAHAGKKLKGKKAGRDWMVSIASVMELKEHKRVKRANKKKR